MRQPFQPEVESVIHLLVGRRYEELEHKTGGKRLKAADIAWAVAEYGRRLVELPPAAYQTLDVHAVRNAQPAQWHVLVDLWTAEEGRSDLTMELRVRQTQNGYDVELDDIHVL